MGLLLLLLLGLGSGAAFQNSEKNSDGGTIKPEIQNASEEEALPEAVMPPVQALYAGIFSEFQEDGTAEVREHEDAIVTSANPAVLPEVQIYSFLQGPKSWGEGRDWSGEWSGEYVKGGYFGSFGCGFCCMANLYCTLTDYTCSPWDMFEYARQVSGYTPTRKIGAIGWGDMKVTLAKSGFDTSLNQKPSDYEDFRRQVSGAKGAVALVCSRDDDTYWVKTGGHYVNIWSYDEKADQVFLSDPGDPEHNRERIPLRYVYDALKTGSQYQFLLVHGYSKEKNQWKQDGIDEAWTAPES